LKDAHKIVVPYKRVYKGKKILPWIRFMGLGAKVLITCIGLRLS